MNLDAILAQLYAERERVRRAIALLEELQGVRGDDASHVPKPQQYREAGSKGRPPPTEDPRLPPIGAAPKRGPSCCHGSMDAQLHLHSLDDVLTNLYAELDGVVGADTDEGRQEVSRRMSAFWRRQKE